MCGSSLAGQIRRRGRSVSGKAARRSSCDLDDVPYSSSRRANIAGKAPRHRSCCPDAPTASSASGGAARLAPAERLVHQVAISGGVRWDPRMPGRLVLDSFVVSPSDSVLPYVAYRNRSAAMRPRTPWPGFSPRWPRGRATAPLLPRSRPRPTSSSSSTPLCRGRISFPAPLSFVFAPKERGAERSPADRVRARPARADILSALFSGGAGLSIARPGLLPGEPNGRPPKGVVPSRLRVPRGG